jgi:hypothetical protein
MHLHISTIYLDIQFIRESAKRDMKTFVTELLPETIVTTVATLRLVTKTAWNLVNSTEDKRVIVPALNLIRECAKDRLNILADVNIVDKIVATVEEKKEQAATVPVTDQQQAIGEYVGIQTIDDKEEPETEEED